MIFLSVQAADPVPQPPYVDAMYRMFQIWQQEGLLRNMHVELVLNPDMQSGLLRIRGGATIEFDNRHGIFNAQFAVNVMNAYLKDGPIIAGALGVPFPHEVYIQPLISNDSSFVPLEPRMIADPLTGVMRAVPVIRFSSADVAANRGRRVLMHEFTHTICECGQSGGQIPELLSHLIEQRMGIRPAFHDSFPGLAIDFAPNGIINMAGFNAEFRSMLSGTRVPAHEHAFGVLLGDALISRSGVPDFDQIITIFRGLQTARQSNDPDAVARALGFRGGFSELIRTTQRAFYDQYARATSSNVRPFFDNAIRAELAYRAAHPTPPAVPPPLSSPPIGGVFDANPGIPPDPLRFFPPEAAATAPPPLSVPTDPSLYITPPAASAPSSVTYPAMLIPSAPRLTRPPRLPTRPPRGLPFVP